MANIARLVQLVKVDLDRLKRVQSDRKLNILYHHFVYRMFSRILIDFLFMAHVFFITNLGLQEVIFLLTLYQFNQSVKKRIRSLTFLLNSDLAASIIATDLRNEVVC